MSIWKRYKPCFSQTGSHIQCKKVHSYVHNYTDFSVLGLLIEIVQEPDDVIALPGENNLFQCVFVDERSLLVSAEFFRNGQSTKGLERHSEFHNPGTTITIGLQIVNITREDDGAMYHCSPLGQPDITSRLVTITVAGTVLPYSPKLLNSPMDTMY